MNEENRAAEQAVSTAQVLSLQQQQAQAQQQHLSQMQFAPQSATGQHPYEYYNQPIEYQPFYIQSHDYNQQQQQQQAIQQQVQQPQQVQPSQQHNDHAYDYATNSSSYAAQTTTQESPEVAKSRTGSLNSITDSTEVSFQSSSRNRYPSVFIDPLAPAPATQGSTPMYYQQQQVVNPYMDMQQNHRREARFP
ncbi:unnamed protein product [Ambrosiozyma monospora]|uniref:Unnamed protein product n=1 Tax=Ambrosiozyma monospora TaxID=43982 RepID=A0ACB5UB57_AMBMO|nr:unnamed protein product [Ambrosiozyma monospora]